MQSHDMIISELRDLISRVRSECGKEQVRNCIRMVKTEFRTIQQLKAEVSEFRAENDQVKSANIKLEAECKLQAKSIAALRSDCSDLKQKLTVAVNQGLLKAEQFICLMAKNKKIVKVSRELAVMSSPHIKSIIESEMNENKSGIIQLKQYSETCIRALAAFMQAGNSCPDIVDVQKVSGSEIYMLLELLAYMRMPWAFASVTNRAIDFTDPLDALFLANVSKQAATCSDEYQDGWTKLEKKAMENVEPNIERLSIASGLQELALEDISKIILNMKDEKLPDIFSDNQSAEAQERFYLKVTCEEKGSISAFVHVGQSHPFAFKFNARKAGQFHYVLQAKHQDGEECNRVPRNSNCVSSGCGFPSFFANDTRKQKFCPGPGLEGLKLMYKAGMTRLHRQVFALTCYACKRMGRPFAADCQSEQLLGALGYFDRLAAGSDEGARKLLPLMEEYVARSFDLIKGSGGWRLLSPPLVSRILAKDCLYVQKETAVLGFAARYAGYGMAAAAGAADGAEDGGGGAGSSPADRFAALAQHVRFPWISAAQLDAELAPGERAFAARQPSFAALLLEATEVQQRKRPAAGASGAAAGRAAKRACFAGEMPALDMSYMVDRLAKVLAAGAE